MADFFTDQLVALKDKKVQEINSGGKRLPMLPASRPVDPQWKCQKSGECCTIPQELVMTKEEANTLVFHAPPTVTLQFRPLHDNFVAMKVGPCPLYVFHTCIVYEHRPYQCRRFACMRPDTQSEPFEEGGPLGCKNLSDRVATSRVALRQAKHIQKKAQGWAQAHGWNVEEKPNADSTS